MSVYVSLYAGTNCSVCDEPLVEINGSDSSYCIILYKSFVVYFAVRLYASVKLMFAIAIFFTYGIQFYVPIEILWPSINNRVNNIYLKKYGEYLLRFFFLCVTCKYLMILYNQ